MLKMSLCALAVAAGVSAYAEGPVTLKSGATTDWADFAAVINGTKTVTATVDSTQAVKTAWSNYITAAASVKSKKAKVEAQQDIIDGWAKKYKAANDSLTDLTAAMNAVEPKTEQANLKWFTDNWDAFAKFQQAYDADETGKGATKNVWYYFSGKTASPKLTLSFMDPGSTTPVAGKSWIKATEGEYYEDIEASDTQKVATVEVFLGYKEGSTTAFNYGTTGMMTTSFTSSTPKDAILTYVANAFTAASSQSNTNGTVETEAYTNAKKLVTDKTAWKNKLMQEQTAAEEKLPALQTALTNAETTLSTEKANWESAKETFDALVESAQANAKDDYQEITLTADIDANVAITADFAGTIYGNGKVINVPAGTTLFKNFKGILTNAAINGSFASLYVGATFADVAAWTGTAGSLYDEQNNKTSFTDFQKLGYAARAFFGANLATNKLTQLTNDTKVFDLTVYTVANKTQKATQAYVNLVDGVFKNTAAVTIPTNNFAVIQNNDFGTGVTVPSNVIYNGVAENVTLTDGVAFYSPVNFTANNLTVAGNGIAFKEGPNTTCLPFELKQEYFGEEDILSTYDKETTTQFWFTKAETVAANTPALLKLKSAVTLSSLNDVEFMATPDATQLMFDEGAADEASKSCGTFKKANVDEVLGGSGASQVWGLKGNDFVPAVASGTGAATFPVFRMVIASANTPSGASLKPGKAPVMTRSIVITDGFGNIISGDDFTTGVESVSNDEAALKVVGGQGVINITSEADYGKISVYNINGAVVEVADVNAGTTSVELPTGVYIVLGKKVMVK